MSEQEDNAGIVTHPPVFYIVAAIIGVRIDYLFPLSFGSNAMLGNAGIIIFVLGLIIALLSFKIFASNKQSPSVHASASKVYQSGVYAYSRNPIYFGIMLWLVAAALYFDNAWLLIVTVPLILFMNKAVIEKEEAYLANKFGDDYLDYKKKVRRWI
ncbi:MAG: isoprenylcysteine carboxylmethyltransferase family protein [Emcibacteraceae bacterium]|nr:isoprenylcysteine carboxylmethyltransferase family protein [Emcibacteraceae bacterium]